MQRLKSFGIVGAVIAGLLCFTPILAVAFAATGLSWATGYIDYFLIPLLLFFVGLVIYAYVHGRKRVDT